MVSKFQDPAGLKIQNGRMYIGGGCGSAPVGDKFCRPSQKSEKSPRTKGEDPKFEQV